MSSFEGALQHTNEGDFLMKYLEKNDMLKEFGYLPLLPALQTTLADLFHLECGIQLRSTTAIRSAAFPSP